ncbi:MAG: GNAT family N-acetyltransferase [Acidimicrobiales bacterium]
MSLELRPITDDERRPFVIALENAFGDVPEDDVVDAWSEILEVDRTLIATDGGLIVANSGAWSLSLGVPGGPRVPMAAVTAVGVAPTHRRQGLLTRMMAQLHEQAREREEPIAGLSASDSGIYGRFGYGTATRCASAKFNTNRANPAESYSPSGTMRMVDVVDSFDVIKSIRRKYEVYQVGESTRSDDLIQIELNEGVTFDKGNGSPQMAIHRSAAGEDDGYIKFRRKGTWSENGLSQGTLNVRDLAWSSQAVFADLWRFVIDIDLVETVTTHRFGPIDNALWHTFAEPRQIQITGVADMLWLAILDVPSALAARTYEQANGLVIAVPMVDGSTQTVELEGSPKGATCVTTTREPDVIVPQQQLSSIYLGDQSAIALHEVGLIEGELSAVERLAGMFKTQRLPYTGWEF